MPIPKPHKGESRNTFVSRCISAIYDEYKDHKGQAVAICETTWRDHHAKAAYVVRAGDDEYAFEGIDTSAARDQVRADELFYQSLRDAGVDATQAHAEMVKRGHSDRYISLIARRVDPKPLTDINNPGPRGVRNPDNSNAPSSDLPMRGSDNQEKMTSDREDADSMDDDSAKPDLDDMVWYMGSLETEKDLQTGLAKWPLSFKRISKDTKRGRKGYNPTPPSPTSVEIPPRAV